VLIPGTGEHGFAREVIISPKNWMPMSPKISESPIYAQIGSGPVVDIPTKWI